MKHYSSQKVYAFLLHFLFHRSSRIKPRVKKKKKSFFNFHISVIIIYNDLARYLRCSALDLALDGSATRLFGSRLFTDRLSGARFGSGLFGSWHFGSALFDSRAFGIRLWGSRPLSSRQVSARLGSRWLWLYTGSILKILPLISLQLYSLVLKNSLDA